MTVDLWDLRLQSDSNPISPPQCHMVITALPCSTTFPCQQLHPPPPFDSLRYRHIACILPCLSLVSLPYRTYVLSKNKKCCPCCGHKKQLPAVLDPSLLPPTITCSHLRLPFDPSPFPLKFSGNYAIVLKFDGGQWFASLDFVRCRMMTAHFAFCVCILLVGLPRPIEQDFTYC